MTITSKDTLIGKRIPKLDARKKVVGEAVYVHDIELSGMLVGKILRTDRVHARILSIDTSAAERLPGVHAVLTAADTPGVPLGHGKDTADRTARRYLKRWEKTGRAVVVDDGGNKKRVFEAGLAPQSTLEGM